MPVLAASVSSDRLFEVFMALLDPLGEEVDVVMESSHDSEPGAHADLYREHMDTVILKSTLYDYEELLLNDGCTGLAALNPGGRWRSSSTSTSSCSSTPTTSNPFEAS
jgi:hypothetical protein